MNELAIRQENALFLNSTTIGLCGMVGAITERTLAGIWREGKERACGQAGGLTRADMERVCMFAEASKTLAGLRDSAVIRLMSDCLLQINDGGTRDVR